MDNQQLYNLTNQEIQLLLSLYFGDGHYMCSFKGNSYSVNTNCINKDYLEFKKNLISNLKNNSITLENNKGYKKDGMIYKWRIFTNSEISKIYLLSFQEKLNLLDELGIALWFYDDGSLHKNKYFYNLCTHAFTLEEQLLIIEKLKDFGIKGHILKEVKKDGRIFFYISVNKYSGAFQVSELMNKVKIESMNYKLWSSTTSQEWRTLQEEWKSKEDYCETSFIKFMKFNTFSKARKGKKHKPKI